MNHATSGLLVLGHTGSLPDSPSLKANAILRLILCPFGLLSIWVPLSQLWRNGEFSACVFVVNNWLLVLIVFVNAAFWHNQNFDSWWRGVGWCDLLSYVQYAMMTLFCSSACAIMRRLSKKVGLTRVAGLSARERRNNLLVQSLIMFPLPLLQVIVTVFVSGERYRIMPVSGCATAYYPNAVFLVIYLIPPPLFTIGTCFHTVQTYRRFREIDASSRETLTSAANTSTSLRRQRARRKLYFMIMCIMVPYTPMIVAFLVFDLMQGWPFHAPVDFHFVHYAGIAPYNSIALMSYAEGGFMSVNFTWIPVIASFISFIFFGTSKEAINMYRRTLVAVGLGRVFPRLNEVYDPDRSRATASSSQLNSTVSSTGTQLSTACTDASSIGPWSRKGSQAPILPPQRQQSSSSRDPAAGRDSSIVQAPVPSAWRSGLRRLVAARPYAALAGRPRAEDVELEGGQQRQVSAVSFRDPFREPFPVETFPPSFPQPFPEPHPQQAAAHTATTTTRPILHPGLNWTTPPSIQDAASLAALRRPSATADATTGDLAANASSSPPSRLRRLFPLAASTAAAPPPPGERTPIYDGTTVAGAMASSRPAGTAATPAFETLVWSGAGSARQQQPKTAVHVAAPVHRKPMAGGSKDGGGPAVQHEAVGMAAAHGGGHGSQDGNTDVAGKASSGVAASSGNTSEAAPSGVRVERYIVTSKTEVA